MLYVVAPTYAHFKEWCRQRGIKVYPIMDNVIWIYDEQSLVGRHLYPEDKIFYEYIDGFHLEDFINIQRMIKHRRSMGFISRANETKQGGV